MPGKPTFDPKVGDWECECGNWNWARRTKCHLCKESKPGPARTNNDASIGSELAEKYKGLFSVDDWKCPMCDNINWARRSHCNECTHPKPGQPKEDRGGAGGGYNERQDVEYIDRSESDDEYDDFGRKKKKFRASVAEEPTSGQTSTPRAEKSSHKQKSNRHRKRAVVNIDDFDGPPVSDDESNSGPPVSDDELSFDGPPVSDDENDHKRRDRERERTRSHSGDRRYRERSRSRSPRRDRDRHRSSRSRNNSRSRSRNSSRSRSRNSSRSRSPRRDNYRRRSRSRSRSRSRRSSRSSGRDRRSRSRSRSRSASPYRR